MEIQVGTCFDSGSTTKGYVIDMTEDFAKVQMCNNKLIDCDILQKMHNDDWEFTGFSEQFPDATGYGIIRSYLFKRIDRGL